MEAFLQCAGMEGARVQSVMSSLCGSGISDSQRNQATEGDTAGMYSVPFLEAFLRQSEF